MGITGRLLRILGRRAFVTFGLVTFLVSALLATVNLTSRYALKLYVEDQLERIPWDLAVYQRGGITGKEALPAAVGKVDGVTRVESLTFLRARFPEGGEVLSEVDGKPLTTPWLCLLAASDMSILPPQLSFALEKNVASGQGAAEQGAVLALVGPERAMGRAFLALQGSKEFTVHVKVPGGEEDHHHAGDDTPRRYLFSTPVRGVIRLDRDELNRWLMDQTGSVSYVPYIGLILLMPNVPSVIEKFDAVATGIVPLEVMGEGADPGHIQMAEYEPEMVYLGRLDRSRLISGWDITGSLERVAEVNHAVDDTANEVAMARHDSGPRIVLVHDPAEPTGKEKPPGAIGQFIVDSTTQVLLGRMDRIARLVGVLSLLVALPLLWMAWVLGGNLAGLLMLNERRTLGLMRLRGISGQAMGRALLTAIVGGGLVGGLLGLVAGSVIPLLVYEGGRLPLDVITSREQLLLFGGFLVISVILALIVSRRVVRYATTISPLEASRRVSTTEAARSVLHFGTLQFLALVIGIYVLAGWTFDFSLSTQTGNATLRSVDRVLDFLGLPFFLYGLSTLIASKRQRIQHVMAPLTRPIGGHLGRFAMQHVSVKPHRTMAFLLIVALASSVSLYPTITGRSFSDKAVRGARVQLGTDWQLLYNAPDLADVALLRGPVGRQLAALQPEIDRTMESLRNVDGVTSVTYLLESVLPSSYLPGYGLKGVPLYLLPQGDAYRLAVYSEGPVGIEAPFDDILRRVQNGGTASSPPVTEFWRLTPDTPVLMGMDEERRTVALPSSGSLAYLPGIPPRTVTDRQGYVAARVDYLNHLFSSNAYLVANAANPDISTLQVLIPRVIFLVSTSGVRDAEAFATKLSQARPYAPLEIHDLDSEIGKVGTDMFISLALANMRIYLLGGLALALIAILSIAMANYVEDRRTLGLLRIRGASPSDMRRFIVAMLLSPAILGLVIGVVTALIAGFGLANYVWKLREIQTVVQLLPTRLVASSATVMVGLVLAVLLLGTAAGFSWWVYRRTATQGMREA
jgi:hypothetical protein